MLVSTRPEAAIAMDPVAADLAHGRPLHPVTWCHLLARYGLSECSATFEPDLQRSRDESSPSPHGVSRRPSTCRQGQFMRTRPVRIDQVIPSIVERDAVSHHTLEAQRVLHSMGFVSEIYACNMGPGLAGRVHLLEDLPRERPEHQWVCYQASIGSPAADMCSRRTRA